MGLVINPKTKRPVLATTDGEYVAIRSVEESQSLKRLGRGYHSENYEDALVATGYPRVHTPEGVTEKGMGYGTSLYTALCLGAQLQWKDAVQIGMRGRGDGISSDPSDRSREASRWWAAALNSGLTDQEAAEGDDETEENVDLDVSPSDLEDCVQVDGQISYVNRLSVDIVRPGEDKAYDYYRYQSALEHHLIAMSFAFEVPRVRPATELMALRDYILEDPREILAVDPIAIQAIDVRGLDPDLVQLLQLGLIAASPAGADDPSVDELWYRYEHGLDPGEASPQTRLAFRKNAAAGLDEVSRARQAAGWAALAELP